MDALSEALVTVRATAAIFFRVECGAPWGFVVPNVNEVAHLLSPGTERLINYHLVTDGCACVHMEDGNEFWVEAGEIVILPHGDAHTVSKGHPNEFADSRAALGHVLSGRPLTLRLGSGDDTTRIICGFIGCERSADRLFLAGLPKVIKVDLRSGQGADWLAGSIQHLVSEAESESPGAAILLARMAESLFVESLRRFMRDLPDGQSGWLAGARDQLVGAALSRLHRNPHRRWTLDDLAAQSGASRSVLAKRFSRLMGQSPMKYLRQWRLYLAADALRTTNDPILRIAMDVGYESEAAFNRAFATEYGTPPARYRRRFKDGEVHLASTHRS